MRFLFITAVGDSLVPALRALGHEVDEVTPANAGDATAVLGVAQFADAVLHGNVLAEVALGDAVLAEAVLADYASLADWAAELPGIRTAGLNAEEVIELVNAGDPDVGRAAIARSFGPRLAAWGIPPSSSIVDELAAALALFED